MTAPTQLSLYNGALRVLGERPLASLTVNEEPRYLLDAVWSDDLFRTVLNEGLWNFAARTVQLTADPSVATQFGYLFAFAVPDDYVRTMGLSGDEFLRYPLTRYIQENGEIYADLDTIYFRYVSDSTSFGGDLSKWPPSFTRFVQAHMALEIAPNLTGAKASVGDVEKTRKTRLTEARSRDAMNEAAAFMPSGSWTRSRSGRFNPPDRPGRTIP